MEAENFSAGRYVTEHPSIELNKSFSDHRSLDMLKSKRFSIGGLGGVSDHFPTASFHGFGKDGDKFDMIVSMVTSPKKPSTKTSRLGSIGFLSSSIFDEPDHAKINRRCSMASVAVMNRRGSMASVGTFASAGMEAEEDDDNSVISKLSGDVEGATVTDLPPPTNAPQQPHFHSLPQPQPRPKPQLRLQAQTLVPCTLNRPLVQFAEQDPSILVAPKMNQVVEAFASAMAQSHKSQQAIHDWDKKMGLKRSHSKTMRLTMRSRKKLKSMLKKAT